MNKVILMGNLGSDPELRMTGKGGAVLKMSLATSYSWKDDSGKKQERTEWHRLVMWGKRAEALAQHLAKGQKILVAGRIQYGNYEKDGVKHYTTDIVVDDLEFCGSRGDKRESGPSPYGGGYGEEQKSASKKPIEDDDDIPF